MQTTDMQNLRQITGITDIMTNPRLRDAEIVRLESSGDAINAEPNGRTIPEQTKVERITDAAASGSNQENPTAKAKKE